MTPEQAQTIALRALGWLASNEELLPVFLGASGASGAELAARAEDPEFLISVLDFLTMDDAWVIAFCDVHGLAYDQPLMARRGLPGGEEVSWT